MYELAGTSALDELVRAHHELLLVHHQVVVAAGLVPRHESREWSGPAAFVYHLALDELARELARAADALRVTAELTVAGVAELGGHV
jgi:hypothetical protein